MVEDKDIDIQYIRSEYNPADIITKNTSEAYFSRHTKTITNRELWELMETGRDNVNNNRVMDEVIIHNKTEYSSHALAEFVDGKHKNDWILIMISSTAK